MADQAPRIESVRDLSPLYEAFSEEDDEHGNPIFLYSSFGFITNEYVAYFDQSKLKKYELTQKDIKESLELLPDEDVYPEAPSLEYYSRFNTNRQRCLFERPKAEHGFYGYGSITEASFTGSRGNGAPHA